MSDLASDILRLAEETGKNRHLSWFEQIRELALNYVDFAEDASTAISAITHFVNGGRNQLHLRSHFDKRVIPRLVADLEHLSSSAPKPPALKMRHRGQTKKAHPFTFIDLFAGVGGFHLALNAVGGKCVFASEIDNAARTTYAMNFGIVPFGDIRDFTRDSKGNPRPSSEVRQRVPKADIISAGFPCQPFSLAGVSSRNFHGHQHGLNCQAQGTLFEDILIVARATRPKALILENVRNLASHDSGKTLRVIREEIEASGYVIYPKWNQDDRNWAIIDSNSVVGQRRRRVYLVCLRRDIAVRAIKNADEFLFPEFKVTPGRYSLKQIIDRDKTPNSKKFAEFSISERLYKSHLARDRRHRERRNGFATRVMTDLSQPCPTLVARYYKDGKDCLIPRANCSDKSLPPRMLTPKECALLQTFPPNFWIHPRKSVAYKQFGNAITVEVARRISEKLVEFLSVY